MRTKLVVILGFLVAFSAGVVVGLWVRELPADAVAATAGGGDDPSGPPRRSWLARELDLTPAQEEQVKKIWFEAMQETDRGRDDRERWHALRKEREDAIAALIRPEDKAAYEQIQKDHEAKGDAMRREREKAFEQAVARTRELLTPEQLVKHEKLIKKMESDRERGRGRGKGWGRGRDGGHGSPPPPPGDRPPPGPR